MYINNKEITKNVVFYQRLFGCSYLPIYYSTKWLLRFFLLQEELAENARFQLQKGEPDRKCWERICKGFLKAKILTKSVDKNIGDLYKGFVKAETLTENVDKNLNDLCNGFLKDENLKEDDENNQNSPCKGLLKAEILTENVENNLNDLCKGLLEATNLTENVDDNLIGDLNN